jgi:hypothetical protein
MRVDFLLGTCRRGLLDHGRSDGLGLNGLLRRRRLDCFGLKYNRRNGRRRRYWRSIGYRRRFYRLHGRLG